MEMEDNPNTVNNTATWNILGLNSIFSGNIFEDAFNVVKESTKNFHHLQKNIGG